RAPVALNPLRYRRPTVPHIRASENLRVAVENFAIASNSRHSNAILHARDFREIAAPHQEILSISRQASEAYHTRPGIPEIDPIEPLVGIFNLIERRLRAIHPVQFP